MKIPVTVEPVHVVFEASERPIRKTRLCRSCQFLDTVQNDCLTFRAKHMSFESAVVRSHVYLFITCVVELDIPDFIRLGPRASRSQECCARLYLGTTGAR